MAPATNATKPASAWDAFLASRPSPVQQGTLEPLEDPCDLVDDSAISYYMSIRRPGWMARGACRDADLADFFAEGRGKAAARARRRAVQVCRRCPVVDECLNYALRWPVTMDRGVWGATSEDERREMRRRAAS